MNLNLIVKQFFEENECDKLADKILLVRQDGINIYSNISNGLEASSMGALIGGVWQAAQALSELAGSSDNLADYRLGFDTSSDGLYILPLEINKTSYFLGAMYLEQDNPAKLKRSLRFLKENLELYLEDTFRVNKIENEKSSSEKKEPREDDGFLFDSISDDEMDNLFSFEGAN